MGFQSCFFLRPDTQRGPDPDQRRPVASFSHDNEDREPKEEHTSNKVNVSVSSTSSAGSTRYARIRKLVVNKLNADKDFALVCLLKLWDSYCSISKQEHLMEYAVKGLYTGIFPSLSAVDVFLRHHPSKKRRDDPSFSPPVPVEAKGEKLRWKTPDDDFVEVAEDVINVMYLAIAATYTRRSHPPRWTWETTLLTGLRRVGHVTRQIREVAMLVCLILSAATPDDKCILATVAMFEAGLLDLVKLSEAKTSEVERLIKPTGIYERRAAYLQGMAKTALTDHQGHIPSCLEDLLKIKGVGRKTAVLMMNECFCLPEGIGTDVHVTEVSRALGFILEPKSVKCNVDHVEGSLLTWNHTPEQQRMFNPVVGSFAQLFTKQLKSFALVY